MASSIRQFRIGLYEEHLEEAGFLCEQRNSYLHDPEVDWPDLRESEDRLEAHLDGLVLGGRLALEVCRRQLADGDAAIMNVALRILCRHGCKNDALGLLATIDPTNADAVRAATEALCRDAPSAWCDDLAALLTAEPNLAPILASVIGYRRFRCEETLFRALSQGPSLGSAELAWALGRVGSAASIPLLCSLIDSADTRVCESAAVAVLRLGESAPIQRAMNAASDEPWAQRVLGIAGGAQSVGVLLEALDGPRPDAAVIALGLLGDLSAVAPLLDLLQHEQLSDSAAVALNTITGAQLHARVFVPDALDPDELTVEEREAFETDGTVPMRDGKPYGNWERRALRDKSEWCSWLNTHKHRFSQQERWRMGKLYGPEASLSTLTAVTTPNSVRAATYEELVVRFALDVPFEADLPVCLQERFLARIAEWTNRNAGNFHPGSYQFAGRFQP